MKQGESVRKDVISNQKSEKPISLPDDIIDRARAYAYRCGLYGDVIDDHVSEMLVSIVEQVNNTGSYEMRKAHLSAINKYRKFNKTDIKKEFVSDTYINIQTNIDKAIKGIPDDLIWNDMPVEIVLCFLYGLTEKDIAKEFNLTLSAISYRMKRYFKQIRDNKPLIADKRYSKK